MMQRPYLDNPSHSASDLQDYYDTVPPAHQFSGFGRPVSPHGFTQDIPMTTTFRDTGGYASVNTPANSYPSLATKSRKKWVVIGAIVVLALAALGVAVGVSIAKSKHSAAVSSSSTSASGSGTPPGSNPVNQTNPNDPSSFQKDPRLHQSFYGFAYTPEGSQLPECGNSLEQVITDIQLLSQLTTRLRLYGADCNQSALVLEAIKQTKVNMTVYLGNYVVENNNTAYSRQKAEIQQAIQTYGPTNIFGIIVGNEFVLNWLTDVGGSDPNSAAGNQAAAQLIPDITDTRQMLASMGLTGVIPVGNSDAGAYFNNEVLGAVDFGMANDHPWFANVSVDQAAGWTWDFFQTIDVAQAAKLPNNPKMFIAETGWPSASSDVSNESNGPSLASEANLQTFLDTFICQANANGTGYFYFEYFDELWKEPLFGGVEAHWGIFHANRTLKGITIPDCPSP